MDHAGIPVEPAGNTGCGELGYVCLAFTEQGIELRRNDQRRRKPAQVAGQQRLYVRIEHFIAAVYVEWDDLLDNRFGQVVASSTQPV